MVAYDISFDSIVIALAAVSTGVMAGVYFTFSVFVMRALNTLGDAPARKAMNAINRVIVKTAFLPLFFASTGLALCLLFFSADHSQANVLIAAASVLYLAGMFVVTVLFNVPLNNQLDNAATEITWQGYRERWLRWNHARTWCSLFACVFYCLALVEL